jgi:hypothetical protein
MRAHGVGSVLVAVGLVLAVSCGGDESAAPADPSFPTALESVTAAELISVLEEIVGPCVAVDSTGRDGRDVGTCTLASGIELEVDVWRRNDAASPTAHLYRTQQLARSIDCVGTLAGKFAGWLAGGNWMIASTDGPVLDEVADRIGGISLEPPDCDRPACDVADPPWDRIELESTADGVVPSTVDLQADGAELCVTSESADMLNLSFVDLPRDYDTSGLLSAPVSERQVSEIATGFSGLGAPPPISTWLEPGHHLVLVGQPGDAARPAAAIQLRPDAGPDPVYPTLPPGDVVPEAGPLRFLLPEGGVLSGWASDGSGEFQLAGAGFEVSIYWTTLARHPFDEFVDDRRQSGGELTPSTVAGFDAVIVAYSSTDHTAMLRDDYYLYEFRAVASEDEFRSMLGAVTIVSDAAWFESFSPGMTTPEELGTVVTGMLEGIDVPDTLELHTLENLDVSGDRYHVGAAVVDQVVCAWLDQWDRHPVGTAAHDQAVAVLTDAGSWPILVEMERSGRLSDVIRDVGAAVRDDAVDQQAALNYLFTCDI